MSDNFFSIELDNVGKKYRYDWIFKGISFHFRNDNSYAILGPNGIGKSTFMKILSGHLSPSTGKVNFVSESKKNDNEDQYKSISFAAPYIDLIEELDIEELLDFHFSFKKLHSTVASKKDLISLSNLSKVKGKPIKFYSSGMKQRLKLCIAMCTESAILLLDEPTSNLDKQGIEWYQNMINNFKKDRIVIIASNTEHDYSFCNQQLNIEAFK
jgi:ABC-type multidrug transport system ATPase subunit